VPLEDDGRETNLGIDSFFDGFFTIVCDAYEVVNDVARDSRGWGDGGGEGVSGGKLEVDAAGEGGVERQDRSSSKSVNSKREASCGTSWMLRIVLLSSSSSSSNGVVEPSA
jgi:hypothetical protein